MSDDERKPRPFGGQPGDPIDRLLDALAAEDEADALSPEDRDESDDAAPAAPEVPSGFAAWAEAESDDMAPAGFTSRETPDAEPSDEPAVVPGVLPPASAEFPQDAIGAYLLDALNAADQATFIAFAETSPETIAELEELAPIAALLPEVLGVAGVVPVIEAEVPSGEAVVPAAEDDSDAAQAAALAAANAKPLRPVGRLKAGVSSGPTLRESIRDESRWVKTGILMIVIAVVAVLWGLGLQGRIDDQQREIEAQAERLAELSARGNATAFMLQPSGAQTAASGMAYYGWAVQRGVLTVAGLAPLAEGRVYQIWYVATAGGTPVRGETFTVDGTGQQVVLLQPGVPSVVQVMISEEPFGGSPQPTTPFVLSSATI